MKETELAKGNQGRGSKECLGPFQTSFIYKQLKVLTLRKGAVGIQIEPAYKNQLYSHMVDCLTCHGNRTGDILCVS